MKYIDADKLKAEIEKLLVKAKNDEEKAFAKKDAAGHLVAVTKTAVCVKIKKIITSLQQEQNVKPYCREHCQGYKDTGGKCFFEWNCPAINQQEQPEVDLEKEIDKEWAKCEPVDEGMGLESANIVNEQFDSIARHFYELGLNARKEE